MTTDVLWPNAITVRFQNGTERSFRSIYDTLDFLECEWPTHGASHSAAVASCRNALRRKTPTAASRKFFVAACREAKLRISSGR